MIAAALSALTRDARPLEDSWQRGVYVRAARWGDIRPVGSFARAEISLSVGGVAWLNMARSSPLPIWRAGELAASVRFIGARAHLQQ